MKKTTILVPILLFCCCACADWTNEELSAINDSSALMNVLSVNASSDSVILRKECRDFDKRTIRSEEFALLSEKMIATVTAEQYDGVGIAGPQVGILRRIVAVQRFDKSGEPFEVYPNIHIVALRGELVPGMEGCLSVPGCKGEVLRYRDIDIRYTSVATLRDTVETVKDFTAVIFQHECDHLDGILYIDRLSTPVEAIP